MILLVLAFIVHDFGMLFLRTSLCRSRCIFLLRSRVVCVPVENKNTLAANRIKRVAGAQFLQTMAIDPIHNTRKHDSTRKYMPYNTVSGTLSSLSSRYLEQAFQTLGCMLDCNIYVDLKKLLGLGVKLLLFILMPAYLHQDYFGNYYE